RDTRSGNCYSCSAEPQRHRPSKKAIGSNSQLQVRLRRLQLLNQPSNSLTRVICRCQQSYNFARSPHESATPKINRNFPDELAIRAPASDGFVVTLFAPRFNQRIPKGKRSDSVSGQSRPHDLTTSPRSDLP